MSISLKNRDDRLGSNLFSNLGIFLFGKKQNLKIYYPSNLKYKDNCFNIPFLTLCKQKDNVKDTIKTYGGIRGNNASVCSITHIDNITYFKQHYKEQFYNIIKNEVDKSSKYKIPWIDNTKIICIHLRLDDVYLRKDRDCSPGSNYIKELIESDNFKNYDRSKLFEYSKDKQSPINPIKLEQIIEKVVTIYPNKELHLIYKGDITSYNKIIQKYNIKLHTNKKASIDLWLLIHSDILILSKSTFSIMAGYYHQGSKVYSPIWGVITSTGLNTKYDKSNWEYFI